MLKTCLFISLHAASVLGILVDPNEDNYDSITSEQICAEASEQTLAELISPEMIEALALKQEELPSFSESDLGEILNFLDRHKAKRLTHIEPKTSEEQLELLDLIFTEDNLHAIKTQEELDLIKEEVQQHLVTSDNFDESNEDFQNTQDSCKTELLFSPAGQLFSYWLYAALKGDEVAYVHYDYSSHYYESPQVTEEVLTQRRGEKAEAQTEVARPSRPGTAERLDLQAETACLPSALKQEKKEGLSPERIIGEKEFFGPNKVKITWVNGIANDFEDSAASALLLSDIFHGAQVHFFYNPTEGMVNDLIKARNHYNGGDCPEAKDLAEHLRLTLKTTDRIIHIGHSHGGIITARAAEYLTPEERARIDVILVGSPALIPEGVFRSATHYVSDQDPVPSWNPEIYYIVKGFKSNKNVIVLRGETMFYNYGFDHYIESPTHVKALKDYADNYLANEKPPEVEDNWWQRIWWWMFG